MRPPPFLKAKRYLSGIDWIVNAFDHMTKRATGVGNVSQIVLELDGYPSEEELRKRLDAFLKQFPVLYGRPARDFNLAPYWKMPSRWEANDGSFRVSHLQGEGRIEDVYAIFQQEVNTPFSNSQEHLTFHLVYTENTSFIAMTFDHRLFDAWGAEAFLGMFQQDWEMGEASFRGIHLTEPAQLRDWQEKFAAGKQVNRALLSMAGSTPPSTLPLPLQSTNRGFRFRLLSFDESRTAVIIQRAYDNKGYLLLLPYLLAATVQVLHKVFAERGLHTNYYIIPATIDMRSPNKFPQDVFFNHFSFLLFRVEEYVMGNHPNLLGEIRRQMYEQVKARLPRDFCQMSFLMRIAPLPLMDRLMRLYFKGRLASFSFAYLGEIGQSLPRFLGNEVHNMFHLPRVPVPPGLGIVFFQFWGRLNAVFSYLDEILHEHEVDMMVRDLQSALEMG
jgi:hypothetical protein